MRRSAEIRTWIFASLFVVALTTGARAADVQATVDFDVENLPTGQIVTVVNADAGGGDLIGPIGIHGTLPSNPSANSAVIFDSGMRTGGDSDLGSPNQDFGGPGVGSGGGLGQPYQNDATQWNILIVAEDLVDANSDGLVDDPDDGTEFGMLLEFDFTTITEPFIPQDVTIYEFTHLDAEGNNPGEVRLYDAANNLISTTTIIQTGDNGILTQDIGPPGVGVSGVARMEVQLNGSSAIDDIVLEIASGPPPTCTATPGGPLTVEVGQPVTFDIFCETPNPGETLVLDVVGTTGPGILPGGLPAGATMTPALPLDSAPNQTVTSTFDWTPQAGDEGTYEITYSVTDSIGQTSTCSVVLEVTCDLEITAQPSDEIVCEGEDALFSVGGAFTAPATFAWFRNGTAIPGATSPDLLLSMVTANDAGSYEVIITNPCGTLTSAAASLVVKLAPTIEASNPDVTVCDGTTITLTVVASGQSPLSFQWRKDGVAIPGEQASGLTLVDVEESDEGSYDVVVTNECGEATSAPATLTVLQAPVVSIDPPGATVCAGTDIAFVAQVTEGDEPLSYQWLENGVPVPGAVLPFFQIVAAQPTDQGVYSVVVTNPCGEGTASAVLTVRTAPVIVSQPQGSTVCAGQPVNLSVTASGSDPLGYQWKLNGADVPGATASTLSIPMAGPGDAGNYTVVVTNDCGSATSDPAPVDVREAPVITASPVGQTLCAGGMLTLTVSASGSTPLSYQWQQNGADVPGATGPTLVIDPVAPTDAGSYTAIVSNDCGSATSDAAVVVILVGPLISSQPMDVSVCSGEPITLSVTAEGDEPITYQWQKDGSNVPGADGATLSIPMASATDAGTYVVVVSNACDTVVSDPAVVTVSEPRTVVTPPMSQTVCEGASVTLTVVASGTGPLSYQWQKDGADVPGATDGSLVIDPVGAGDAGSYTVTISNDCGETTSAAATLTVDTAPTITAGPVGGSICEGDSITLSVTAVGTAPISYQWQKDGSDVPGATDASLTFDPAVRPDSGIYTVIVSNLCGSVTSAAASLDVQNAPSIVTLTGDQNLCVDDPLALTVVAEGALPITYQWQKDGSDIPNATDATYSVGAVDANDAGTYVVIVTNPCGTATSDPIEVAVIVRPTLDLVGGGVIEACEGTGVTLEVTVTGTEPIVLQWQKDGVDIPGAHDSQLILDPLVPANTGSYTLIATNDCDEVTSDPIALTVLLLPSIVQNPSGNDTTCPGESYTFLVMATGEGPFTYQWFLDGVAIPNETASSYLIPDVQAGDYGDYTVVVTNGCGSIESAIATLGEPAPDFCAIPWLRCDCNADGLCDIADGIYVLRFTFQGFAPPLCMGPCDHNDDGIVDVSDVVFIIGYIFSGGTTPPAPFPDCGVDPTPDDLPCPFFNACATN